MVPEAELQSQDLHAALYSYNYSGGCPGVAIQQAVARNWRLDMEYLCLTPQMQLVYIIPKSLWLQLGK